MGRAAIILAMCAVLISLAAYVASQSPREKPAPTPTVSYTGPRR